MKTAEVRLYVDGELVSTNPIYSDSISISKDRASGEMYRRTRLDSQFEFVGKDYDTIFDCGLDTEFEVRVYDKETETLLAKGTFSKIDCEFDTDNKICSVKTTSADEYDKILQGMTNEFDLVSLAPVRESVHLHKRAILQIYFAGDSKVTNIIGNVSYEVDTQREILEASELINMGFKALHKYAVFNVDFDTTMLPYPEARGLYKAEYVDSTTRFVNDNGYYFSYVVDALNEVQQRLYRPNGTYLPSIFLEAEQGVADAVNLSSLKVVLRASSSQSGTEYGKAALNRGFSYARCILDNIDSPNPVGNYYTLNSNDLCANNLNYRYAMTPNFGGLSDLVMVSYDVQDEPTKWGVNGDGKYFLKPDPLHSGDNVIPIGWNKWIPMSYWFSMTNSLASILDLFNTEWVLNDAYPLWSAIKVLLKQIDPSLSFEGTSAYSQFLYGNISASVIAGWMKQFLYITPITNVKKTYYNQAARKGKITLKHILDMLRSTCQLYWFIDSSKRLRIEHITWFKNGGNYAQQNPIIDLTSVISPMGRKIWSFGQNTFDYDKSSLVKRHEFSWNEQTAEAFDGFAIDIKNKFVSGGTTEKVQVSNFISDIDLIMSAPDALSDDSFALIGTDIDRYCPIASIGNFGMDFVAPLYRLQNPYLSFYFLELAYWLYNVSGDLATTTEYKRESGGDGELRVYSTKRAKTQRVKFPLEASEVGKEGLIKTSLGIGEWIKGKYTPEDGMVEAQIVMETPEIPIVNVGRFIHLSSGVMTYEVKERKNQMTIVFNGNESEFTDWGYVAVTANKEVDVTIVASTETEFDFGWANSTPIKNYIDARDADLSVSGTDDITFHLNEGESICLGYVKDSSSYDNEDKITFNIVVS